MVTCKGNILLADVANLVFTLIFKCNMLDLETQLLITCICLFLLYMFLHCIDYQMNNQESNSFRPVNILTISEVDSLKTLADLPPYENAIRQKNCQLVELSTLPSYEQAIKTVMGQQSCQSEELSTQLSYEQTKKTVMGQQNCQSEELSI